MSSPSTTTPPSGLQRGGTLTYLKPAEIGGLDPVVLPNSGASDGPLAAMVFDMLVYTDPNDGSVKAQTAESLTTSDALVWTLKLKPGIKFSDGTAYDAAAVKFNWDRLKDPAQHATRATQANEMQTIEVVDPLTLRITLTAKDSVFAQVVALIPFIGSPAAIQAKGANFTNAPVGAGPFLLKSWVRDSQMVWDRNPGYWNTQLPYLDHVIVKPIVDETQRVNTLAAGQADMMFVGAASNAQLAESKGAISHETIINGGINIYFNTRRAPFTTTSRACARPSPWPSTRSTT